MKLAGYVLRTLGQQTSVMYMTINTTLLTHNHKMLLTMLVKNDLIIYVIDVAFLKFHLASNRIKRVF